MNCNARLTREVAKLLSLSLVSLFLFSSPTFAETLSVQVRESVLRSRPVFYAPGVANVRYGDRLEKLSAANQGWVGVKLKSVQGFLPSSALSSDLIVLSAKDITNIKADSADVVLAGKGFSKEVEAQYRKKQGSGRFDLVDRVEGATKVSRSELAEFASKIKTVGN